MRLSYFLTQNNRRTAIRATLAHLCKITPFSRDEWEICLAQADQATLEYIQNDFPSAQINVGDITTCYGPYILPLGENTYPAEGTGIASMIAHLEANAQAGAVVGRFAGGAPRPSLPTLVKFGATALRKSALERAGGLSAQRGLAADYDLSFRLLAGGSRIDHRDDVIFQTHSQTAPTAREIAQLLGIARRFLPDNLAKIYWRDWAKKYKALASHSGKKSAGWIAPSLDRLNSIRQRFTPSEPVSSDVVESIFGFRRHAAIIGDWARRSSVWRVVLADYSDNIWATYNACRSSGLQMRCIADNDPAFENMHYHDLPIAPANRAFEGGGIDGVVLTSTEPDRIEANFKSLRTHFRGPILRLCQPIRQATHAQVTPVRATAA